MRQLLLALACLMLIILLSTMTTQANDIPMLLIDGWHYPDHAALMRDVLDRAKVDYEYCEINPEKELGPGIEDCFIHARNQNITRIALPWILWAEMGEVVSEMRMAKERGAMVYICDEYSGQQPVNPVYDNLAIQVSCDGCSHSIATVLEAAK